MPKKLKGGDLLGVFNMHSVAKHQKIAGPFEELFSNNSLKAEKTERGTL